MRQRIATTLRHLANRISPPDMSPVAEKLKALAAEPEAPSPARSYIHDLSQVRCEWCAAVIGLISEAPSPAVFRPVLSWLDREPHAGGCCALHAHTTSFAMGRQSS